MIRKINYWIPSLFFIFSVFIGQAQEAWTLDDCINYAMDNNISVNQSFLTAELAENTLFQSKMNLYTPAISGTVSHSFNFSNSVDPLTYEFVQENTQSTQMSLSGSYSLFEGLGRINTIKANKENLNASELDVESIKNNTRLMITNYYLQVVIANEVFQITKEKKVLTETQLSNTISLIDAGIVAEGDKYEIEAQLSNDELNIVNAEINLQKAFNQLKIVLQIDPFEELYLAHFDSDIDVAAELASVQEIAIQAQTVLPSIQAAELRLKAAEYQLKTAKGSLAPSFSISGGFGTNYFSAARIPTGIDGSGNVIFEDKKFGTQLSDNLAESFSIAMNIPIFGKWQRMIAIDNAKINIKQATLEIKNQTNNLDQEVFNAYTDFSAALSKYQSSEKNFQAAMQAFDYAEQKFNAGVINNFDFETAKNRWSTAQAEFVQAKYEVIFKKLILNYYKTGEIKI